jgi:predicted N-acetyltransferase YhbS
MLKMPFTLAPEAPHQADAVEALNHRAFGPGRYAKTAHRLREGREMIPELAFVATDGDLLAGSVRHWQIAVGEAPALLLGPLAVEPSRRNQGIGCALINRGLEEASRLGHKLVLLVGDLPYYARTGFAPVPLGQIALPGPVDYARLLFRELQPGALAAARGLAVGSGRRTSP